MRILPDASLALLESFAPVFAEPTFQRFLVLMGAALLTTGRRTIANLSVTGSLDATISVRRAPPVTPLWHALVASNALSPWRRAFEATRATTSGGGQAGRNSCALSDRH